jgi:hypothetical protein
VPRRIRGKAVWQASDINAYGASLFADRVRALSLTSIDQLRPEELEAAAFDLAACAFSARLPHTVTPADITISTTRPTTSAKQAAQDARLATSPFADLDFAASVEVDCHLFPTLHTVWSLHPKGKAMPKTAADAFRRATAVLDAVRSGSWPR